MKHPDGLKRCAVFCVLKHGSKFLLLKRRKDPNKGKYVPIGGKIDPYEPPHDAIIRETYEETGIQLKSAKFCGILTETSPINYNWVSFIYMSEIDFITIPHCDEGELQWVAEDDLQNLDTPPTDWYIYQFIAKSKPFVFSAIYDKELKMVEMRNELDGEKMF